MPAGEEKVQARAQMGRSLHYWPSSDWWSVPSAGCIGQSTRAKPMERSQTPKVLRLVPDSMFVSLPPSIFYISVICLLSLSFFLFLQSLKRLNCVLTTQSWRANRAHYTWGILIQKLNITIFRALCPTHVLLFHMYLFRHYMHRYDLSFGQAGLPGSCVYALRSR